MYEAILFDKTHNLAKKFPGMKQIFKKNNSGSNSGARRRSRSSSDSPGLGHMMYFSTDGEAYQVFNCNVETHEDWMQTLRDVDIIYPSGPEGELRFM